MNARNSSFDKSPEQIAQDALAHLRALVKGNGVKADAIKLIRHNIDLHTLQAGTYLELRPVMNERQSPGKIVVGQMVAGREEATRKVDEAMGGAARDAAVKTQITQSLIARPDKGFGLNGQPIALDFLKRDYTWHEICQTCHGSSSALCPKCHGRKVEPCIKCSSRGLMFCPLCRGTGMIQGQKCGRCFGQRYVPCDVCKKTGVMACRTCHGHGTAKCPTCGGAGARSHMLSLTAGAMTYFEYDAKSIPQYAAHAIETGGPALVQDKKVKIDAHVADKENSLGASYEVTFPYGEMEFSVGKKEIKAAVFGYAGDIVNMPHFLDKMVEKGVEELEDAAADHGHVSEKIKNATRYRLIAQAVLYAVRTTPQKAAAQLLKKYDAGLSPGMAERIVTAAERATDQIGRKPRFKGILAGIVAVAAIAAVYYIAPVRASIAALLPDQRYDAILDLLPILLGGFILPICVRMMGAGSIRNALGHLLPDHEKKSLMPKAGKAAWVGYGAAVLLSLIMMEICIQTARPAPWWYSFVRNTSEIAKE